MQIILHTERAGQGEGGTLCTPVHGQDGAFYQGDTNGFFFFLSLRKNKTISILIPQLRQTLIVSTGCINDVDNAHDKPPANADLRTLPAGISTGGGTATTVAASNQMLL